MKQMTASKPTRKTFALLDKHKTEIIEELGAKAFDLLSPRQTREELDVDRTRIPDLVRRGWLEAAPAEYNVGPAHFYYRWRVEFVKRFKRTHETGLSPS
jgi:hypothetical protein